MAVADSIYYQILAGVKNNLLPVVSNTVIRKTLIVFERDTLPILVIAPFHEGEVIQEQQMCRGVWYRYPVALAYVQPGNRLMDEDATRTWLNVRENIRNNLFTMQNLPHGLSVFDVDMDPGASVEFRGETTTMLDVTTLVMTYLSAEKRKA